MPDTQVTTVNRDYLELLHPSFHPVLPLYSILDPVGRNAFPETLRVGILSTYAPTHCGLATFTAALSDALCANGADVERRAGGRRGAVLERAGDRRAGQRLGDIRRGDAASC